MASTHEQRLQIKRAILSELNKELAKKSESLAPSTSAARLHRQNNKPGNASSKFNAQPYSSQPSTSKKYNQPSKPKKDSQPSKPKKDIQRVCKPLAAKKTVCIPHPTPRTEHIIQEPGKYECVRKYVDVWKSKTFGNVKNFSHGTQHFQKALLMKVLLKWKEMTYSKQVEWKLIVRADCHYRFYLREKHWDLWRLYMQNNKTAALNKQKSAEFCSKLLLKKHLDKLRQAVAWRKDYNANKSVAEAMYNRSLAKKVMNRWHQSMAESQIHHEKEEIALHFWSLSLQRQSLLLWHEYKNQQVVKKQVSKVITTFYHNKLLHKSVRSWMMYHRHRKTQHILARRANKLLVSKLQHKYFVHWNEQMYVSIKTRELEDQITHIRQKFVCRRVLQHWKCYSSQVRYEQEQEDVAETHARKKLLSKTFVSLKLYKQHQKHTETLKIIAEKTRHKNIISQHFQTWVEKSDEKSEKKMQYRTLMARKHYEIKLVRQALLKLFDYKEYRLERQEVYDIADSHYQTTITQLMFTNWHLYICYRKTVAIKKESADLHRNDLLYHKYFFTWLKMYNQSINQRQDERIALLHYEKNMSTNYFCKWKSLTETKKRENEAIGTANNHYRSMLLLRGLTAFRHNRENKHKELTQSQVAVRHHSIKQLRRRLEMWKNYTTCCRLENQQSTRAIRHHDTRIVKQCFASWMSYHAILKKSKQTISKIQKDEEQVFVQKCLTQWRTEVKFRKMSTDKNLQAEYHHHATICRRVLTGWLCYIEKRATDHIHKCILLEEAEEHLNKLKQRQILRIWNTKSTAAQGLRLQIELADEHYQQKVFKRTFSSLKCAVQISFKKRLLAGKLANYRADVVLKRHFDTWRRRWGMKIKENKQSETALWFWCVNLEDKVLRAWISYAQYRKNKRRLCSEALEDRRKYLLESGLRQWIGHVTTADQLRNDAALIVVTQQTYRANQLALKWGKHWYNTVRRRVDKRPTKPLPLPEHIVPLLNKENIDIPYSGSGLPANHSTIYRSRNQLPPAFYNNFNNLKTNRPAPKIPSFFVQKKYCQ